MANICGTIILLILGMAVVTSEDYFKGPPSFEYEYFRRRLEANIENYWKSVRFELKKYPESQQALKLLAQHKNALLIDMESLRKHDGYELWRKKELQDLSEIVQKRFHRLQNPKDCDKARKVYCDPVKLGFGSQIHELAVCLLAAYATNRTLVLSPKNRVYEKPWDELFLPMSETCKSPEGVSYGVFTTSESTSDQIEPQVLEVDLRLTNVYKTDFFPLAIPADLGPRLELVHRDPSAWWWGQFVKYVFKLNPTTEAALAKKRNALKFKKPIVGIHIRRGDKLLQDSMFYPLEEYMERADEYFDRIYMEKRYFGKRRVFISTDDSTVIEEARTKYPQYEILGDEEVAEKASTVCSRYDDIDGIVMDTLLLSQCNFAVGTLSSNIFRIVYELKLAEDPFERDQFSSDAQVVESLDDKFFLVKPLVLKLRRRYEVVHPHKANKLMAIELKLNKGDEIMDFSTHQHLRKGVYFGFNLNTSQLGEYHPFNVKEKLKLYKFPPYAD